MPGRWKGFGHKRAGGSSRYDKNGATHAHYRKNGVGTRVHHEGRVEDCPDRICRQIAERNDERPWGVICRHGRQIVEATPTEHTCNRPVDDPPDLFEIHSTGFRVCPACYPTGRMVTPWPCGKCTPEEFEAAERAQEEEYYASLWDEYYSSLSC
ncbi:hypothetical protein [Streptomyces sp. 5-10]|uniref:hypothetical protein n=1 Tax=Streptomyces sp. 5-10 TaxID=878925 RepID=UPI00168A5ADB|nr:hypothetical protein [Streptomyces sp. 5-10]MBD3004810.1 hypothetical protein [Streptomyces sp. 5-10]